MNKLLLESVITENRSIFIDNLRNETEFTQNYIAQLGIMIIFDYIIGHHDR